MSSVLQPMKRNGKKGDIVETGIFCITITVIFLTVYATLYLWPMFVPDKTDAEVVGVKCRTMHTEHRKTRISIIQFFDS